MKYIENHTKVEDLKIAYIGGGSRGWARKLMSDLALEPAMSGNVYLYDIDQEAAKANEIIGNMYSAKEEAVGQWKYFASETLQETLTGADFVVISILPATLEEMGSDIHTPEKYGIYQSVGDTSGPGGIIRALRTIPMYKVIAEAIRDYCPKAWVINYTNPMTICMSSLYRYFPEIKAFGCCHEVFRTQNLIADAYNEIHGTNLDRHDIHTKVLGINHFTWITEARYGNEDLWDIYANFADKYYEKGYGKPDTNWMNSNFACRHRVKFDLFKRYNCIAAAGDRHLAEFCPGKWYLENPDVVHKWEFGLTPISWRTRVLGDWKRDTVDIIEGRKPLEFKQSGEEGVLQMKALLGLSTMTTNVNLPNAGQISNLPLGYIVETNATFGHDSVTPVTAGAIPAGVDNLVQRVAYNQELTVEAAISGDYELAFKAFVNDPLVTVSLEDARKLFNEMLENTKEYLPAYKEYLNR